MRTQIETDSPAFFVIVGGILMVDRRISWARELTPPDPPMKEIAISAGLADAGLGNGQRTFTQAQQDGSAKSFKVVLVNVTIEAPTAEAIGHRPAQGHGHPVGRIGGCSDTLISRPWPCLISFE